MQTALVFALFFSMACFQFLPGNAAPSGQADEEMDFCDASQEDKLAFIACIEARIPQVKEALDAENAPTTDELLNSMCGGNEGENPEESKKELDEVWPKIEECLEVMAQAHALHNQNQ
uniref:Putative secreted protein n=1 Tax=Amblyomma cajennense TaxID=34607 RepID=A0A023FCI2_AMBCJ